jgi:uncharacterized coiled-coil protein SlyX
MNRLIQLKKETSLIVIALLLACFAAWLAPNAFGVVPPPDGGYPGGNTAEGQAALLSLTTGAFNTAVGYLSLRTITQGQLNTAVGAGALLANTGDVNTATGAGALLSNNTGVNNTANGVLALFSNTTGESNTAVGSGALLSNTTSDNNTATGFHALWFNTAGGSNTATGFNALASNTIGDNNTATGFGALGSNSTGTGNTAIGYGALINNATGVGNTALGAGNAGAAVTTANNVICIDSQGANVSNSCFVGHIRGVTTGNADAIPVLIDSAEQLGTVSSSRSFKDDIKPMDQASEAVLALKPVVFHYKSDKTHTTQFGLVAEDVAEVNPALIVRDKEGKPYTVRYDQVNAMLLNEFLKERRKVEQQQAAIGRLERNAAKQEATINELNKAVEVLSTHLKEQAAQIQKVSAQIKISQPAPQVLVSGR